MKIKELIKELKNYPADMEVCVDGYEDGYDYIGVVHKLEVSYNESRS
jgi:hypothetical protein